MKNRKVFPSIKITQPGGRLEDERILHENKYPNPHGGVTRNGIEIDTQRSCLSS